MVGPDVVTIVRADVVIVVVLYRGRFLFGGRLPVIYIYIRGRGCPGVIYVYDLTTVGRTPGANQPKPAETN
jgi:hypothetical protein